MEDRTWFDRLTKIDNILAKQTKILERMEAQLINVSPQIVGPPFDMSLLSQLLQLEKNRTERELEIVFYAYPATGAKATLAPGITKLDFGAGTITDINDITTDMKHSLDSDEKDWLRSIFIDTDKPVVIQLDGSDMIPVDEEKDLNFPYQQFREVKIITTENTRVFVLCCTNPLAILRLTDKPSLVSGGERLIYGEVIDTDGSAEYFEGKLGGGAGGSDALGDTPVGYVQLYPTTVTKFLLESVRYYANPTNAVTYELYLFEQASANDVQNLADLVFDSGAVQVDSTPYIAVNVNKLPIPINLVDVGKLYYLVDWTGDPGTTPGYLEIRGRKLV